MLRELIQSQHGEFEFGVMSDDIVAFLRSKKVPQWLIDEFSQACTSDDVAIGPLTLSAVTTLEQNNTGEPYGYFCDSGFLNIAYRTIGVIKMNDLLHITKIAVPMPHHLDITFSDGDRRIVDVRPLLTGPVFAPLHSSETFATVTLDPVCKTVTWPCGADLAPEALRSLAPVLPQTTG